MFASLDRSETLRKLAGSMALVAVAGLLSGGCGPAKLSFEVTETPAGINASSLEWYSDDSTASLRGYRVAVPGEPGDVDYDPSRGQLLIEYGDSESDTKKPTGNYVVYNLTADHVNFAARGNPTSLLIGNDAVVVSRGSQRQVRDAASGELLNEDIEGYLLLLDDGAIVMDKDRYARINLETGTGQWEREGCKCTGWRRTYRHDDRLYIVADNLTMVNVNTGQGWSKDVSTYHKGHTEALAKNAALACLAGLSGSYSTQTVEADILHNEYAPPLEVDGRVYFSARQHLYCFEVQSGDLVWDLETPEDLGSRHLVEAGQYIAIVGAGWKWENFAVKESRIPTLYLVNRQSGELVAEAEIEEAVITQDALWVDNGLLVITPNRIYRFDDELNLLTVREREAQKGDYLRFLSDDRAQDAAVVRNSRGVLALDPVSLAVMWDMPLGQAPYYESPTNYRNQWEEGARYVFNASHEAARSSYQDSLWWLSTQDGTVYAVDISGPGQLVLEVPLQTEDFQFTGYSGGGIVGEETTAALAIPFMSFTRSTAVWHDTPAENVSPEPQNETVPETPELQPEPEDETVPESPETGPEPDDQHSEGDDR